MDDDLRKAVTAAAVETEVSQVRALALVRHLVDTGVLAVAVQPSGLAPIASARVHLGQFAEWMPPSTDGEPPVPADG